LEKNPYHIGPPQGLIKATGAYFTKVLNYSLVFTREVKKDIPGYLAFFPKGDILRIGG